jgi:hypothetical protein
MGSSMASDGGAGERARTPAAFRVNRSDVVGELIDGEVVLINLRTGTYYSLGGSGTVVWAAAEAGRPVDELVITLEHAAGALASEVRGAVNRLLDELQAEGLISPVDGVPVDRSGGLDPGTEPIASTAGSPPAAEAELAMGWVRPVLERFTDMQDLILLDPVHEVGERGWPRLSAASAGVELES